MWALRRLGARAAAGGSVAFAAHDGRGGGTVQYRRPDGSKRFRPNRDGEGGWHTLGDAESVMVGVAAQGAHPPAFAVCEGASDCAKLSADLAPAHAETGRLPLVPVASIGAATVRSTCAWLRAEFGSCRVAVICDWDEAGARSARACADALDPDGLGFVVCKPGDYRSASGAAPAGAAPAAALAALSRSGGGSPGVAWLHCPPDARDAVDRSFSRLGWLPGAGGRRQERWQT